MRVPFKFEQSFRYSSVNALESLPPIPLAADPDLPPADTWGKRSYASPPDEPAPGDDVFDVHSLSTATGINGRPYREW